MILEDFLRDYMQQVKIGEDVSTEAPVVCESHRAVYLDRVRF